MSPSEENAMATFTAGAVPRRARANTEAAAGALLAAGASALFLGTLFYARLTPRLGLPAAPAERALALADALSLGSQKLWLAGGFAFVGDCILLANRRGRRGGGLDSAGFALMAVASTLAMTFDSMSAALFWPLAQGPDPNAFQAAKAWFDFLFSAANVPYGLGLVAVLTADILSDAPLLPKRLGQFGILVGLAAAGSGLGSVTGLVQLPLVIGLTVTFGCVVLAVLGVQIVRTEPPFGSDIAA